MCFLGNAFIQTLQNNIFVSTADIKVTAADLV